jgi:hypothetical protein
MSLLATLKHSAFWRPFSRLYQRSGLKARVYSRSANPPVRTVSEEEVYSMLGLTKKPHHEAPEFCPPIPANCGPMPPEDATFFARFVAALSPKSVFEFGTNWGVSTASIASNTTVSARIQTLDVCREMFSAEHLKSDPELQMILLREHTGWHYKQRPDLLPKIEQIFADSMAFDMTPQVQRGFTHDLILVDACHAFDFVKKDTENALKSLAPGGCMIWHDFYPDVSSWTDVFRYVSDFAAEHPGVVHVKGTHFALWVRPEKPVQTA